MWFGVYPSRISGVILFQLSHQNGENTKHFNKIYKYFGFQYLFNIDSFDVKLLEHIFQGCDHPLSPPVPLHFRDCYTLLPFLFLSYLSDKMDRNHGTI